jgi:N-methylhydantoinase B
MSELATLLRFEILRTELQAAADEMAIRLMRSSFSPIIRDFLDFSTALCDSRGRMVAQGFSLPLHLGAIPRAVEAALERFPGGLEPGDAVLLNDPYTGGMHLPDLFLITPAHLSGRLLGYAVAVAHHADIGGRVPGGSAADSREVFEEGIRIPPVLVRRSGLLDRGLEQVIRANVRLPDVLWRDLEAQFASCNAGSAAIQALVARYGVEVFAEECERILAHTRTRVAAELATWPEGEYGFEDCEDHNGIEDRRVPIRVTVRIRDGRAEFDFAGTSPQVPGSINCTLSFTESACYAAVRSLCADDVPVNAGFIDQVTVRAPAGTVVNAAFPAGVAARGVIGYRIIETIFGALAGALSERVPAAGDGGTSGIRIGGFRDDGTRFQFNDIVCGAWGARPGLDGLDGAAGMAANISNRSIESAEREDPVRVHAYGLVPDSGGPGRHRGGLAVRRVVELLAPEATLQLRTHRNLTPPYGLRGGHAGHTSTTYLIRDGVRQLLPAKTTTQMRRGDIVEHVTASGGGVGPPEERDRALLEADLAEQKVSPERFAIDYPTVILEAR